MSDSPGSPASRMLVEFTQDVACEPFTAGRDWRCSGLARASDGSLQPCELLLSAAQLPAGGPAPPARLQDVSVRLVTQAEASEPGVCLTLGAREGVFVVRARAMQLHRDAAQSFFRAVPPARVPLATRCAWALLLTLLRLPVVARRLV
jgi:hypothetical protein